MWILALTLACGGGDAPQGTSPSPQSTPVQALSMEEQVQAGNLAANALLSMFMEDASVIACLGELQGSGEPARMGFRMVPGGELELTFESGHPQVDACVLAAHGQVVYSEITVPVPFEVETQVPL